MSNATLITFSGNLADAPELKITPAGKATARMRVAVDSRRRDSISGEWVDGPTSWYTVIAWDTLGGSNLAATLGKGDRVIVHGRLEQREWTALDDAKHNVWEVTAEDAGPSLRMPACGGASQTWTTFTIDKTKETAAPAGLPRPRPGRGPAAGRRRATTDQPSGT
ncbi:MAG TPA: single-stranded DNA-binding protein [Sporichthyaceae bacterium]|jgi:single-strand DNA-binding protein|nr:single-stranded DNA-binding protein [Sporichthyaceae bacterium]